MAEYIERDLFLKNVKHNAPHIYYMVAPIALITPAADVAPVRHGMWEDEHGGKYANPRYRCSVCKKRALYKFERDLLDTWKEVQALTPNCPYCMAKLDGGKEV